MEKKLSFINCKIFLIHVLLLLGRVLAHAFFPSNGDVHFDDEENWGFGDEVGNTKTDFFTVAVHEFGHTMGLFHSDVQGALMYPYYSGYNASFTLHDDDVKGMQSLYGVYICRKQILKK